MGRLNPCGPPSGVGGDDALAHGVFQELQPVVHAQLLHEVGAMVVDVGAEGVTDGEDEQGHCRQSANDGVLGSADEGGRFAGGSAVQ